jgi:hypothetical protein
LKKLLLKYIASVPRLLKQGLSSKYAGLVCVVTAVIIKSVTQVYFFDIMGDKSFQLLAAKNLLAGNGLTINQVFADNIMIVRYTPLVGWPPGYSLLLAPLLSIFKNNVLFAALCFDLICVIPFFYYLSRLLSLVAIETWLKNLFILGAGFFFYPFASYYCTDFAAIVCLLAGFYYTVNFIVYSKKLYYILYIVLALFLSVLLRYLYLPVIFSIPAGMIAIGIINGKKKWIEGAIVMAVLLAVSVFFLLLFQKVQTGDAVYIIPTQKGFYFHHFFRASPFIPGSFFDLQIVTTFLSNITGKSYRAITPFLIAAGYLSLFFLLALSVQWLRRIKAHFKKELTVPVFTFIGICVSCTTILALFYLSFRNDSVKQPGYDGSWTFVEEFRYYAFCIVFIQLLAFVYLFNRYKTLTGFWKVTAVAVAVVLTLQFMHRVYFVSKVIITKNDRFYFFTDEKKQTDLALSLPQRIQQQFPDHEVIVTSSSTTFCNFAGLNNVKTIYNPDFLNNPQIISHHKPLKIIVILSKYVLPLYSKFLENPDAKLTEVIGEQYFYILDVHADKL